ncbi:TetR/AcrR family transcriptional regulator [Roseomonas sp. 18066]|uniref:TetR/AcrR family transcriptional regulator n=1 Tax=Roseomonas sp. 18066 TaxID=2681412 RepID=UPI00135A6397|nr:TetR/AcrR family transcriptional regulator [Roseomonas sp. 18066]
MTTNISRPSGRPTGRPRGRPRSFDPEQAVATAQRLFHARGYDAVSIAEITEALGINPPSFYAAFGSKAALYARTLCRYTGTAGIPLDAILRPGRPVAEALAAVLEDAAGRYAADPDGPGAAAAGCLTIEGARCNDPEAREAARALTAAATETLHRFIAATHPEAAAALTDFTTALLVGMSGMARAGHGRDRLLGTARLGGLGIAQALGAAGPAGR